MKSFKQFISEAKDDPTWVNQYSDVDRERTDKAAEYLSKRGMRKGSKWDYGSTSYGSEKVGPNMKKRVVNLIVRHKDTGEERNISVKPDVEKNPSKYKAKPKVSRNMN